MDLKSIGLNEFFTKQFPAENRAPGQHLGRIANVQKGAYLILGEQGELWGKPSGAYLHESRNACDLPVVGDWVVYSWARGDQTALVRKRLDRRNCLSRAAAGADRERPKAAPDRQIIAANVDVGFIVAGLDRDYSPRRIERYLTIVYDSGATPVIVLNKADLCPNPEEKISEISEIAIGVSVYAISAEKQADLAFFNPYLTSGKTGVLLGSSGVGKSTIINRLLGEERQAVSTVSTSVGKGMHTTTTRELLLLPGGGIIIDNPGMRELQLLTDESALEAAFSDIEELSTGCRFTDCRHVNEPGCAVKNAVANGGLDPDRYRSYLKLHREINFLEEREIKGYKVVEREQHRKLRIYQRQLKKRKQV